MQGTLIALIAIASMALPSASQVHWIARALWLFSLLSGLISVLYACNQQMTISRNLQWDDIWRWMNDSRGKGDETDNNNHEQKDEDDFHVPDFFAVLLISGPRILLHHSLRAYITGLGVYLGFVWQDHLDTEAAPDDNRNIFIFFMISLAVCYTVYWLSDVANRCKNSPWMDDFVTVVSKDSKNIGVSNLRPGKGEQASCLESSQDCRNRCR
jgi:hypothetical protein